MIDQPQWTPEMEAKLLAKTQVYGYYFDHLHFCGCGHPFSTLLFIRDVLKAHAAISWAVRGENPCGLPGDRPTYDEARDAFNKLLASEKGDDDTRLYYMTLYTLDAAGFTEHGGSVGGGWLTSTGEDFLTSLLALTDAEIDEVMRDGGHYGDDWEGSRDYRCSNEVLRGTLKKYIQLTKGQTATFTKEELALVKQLE